MSLAGPAPRQAFISLGANLGDARATLVAALQQIADLPGTVLSRRSGLYRSAPVEAQGPDYYNAVAEVHTFLTPEALLRQLQAIEQQHGRDRPYRNAPRTLDLDLLLFEGVVQADTELTLPHPRMHLRAFVLGPLAELSPHLRVPGHGAVRDLLSGVAGQSIESVPEP